MRTFYAKIIFAFVVMFTASSVFADSMPWRSYSDSAFSTAKAQNKMVFVYVKADFCHWCAKMNSETFSSPAMISFISKNFIPVSVDMSERPALSRQLGVRGTPTLIIMDGNHHELSRAVGYKSSSELKSFLQSH